MIILLAISLLFANHTQAQNVGNGKIEWKHKSEYNWSEIHFIGSDNEKLFFVKKDYKKGPSYEYNQAYHKKAGTKELMIYDPETNVFTKKEIKIKYKNWFINYFIFAGRLHTVVSSYNQEAKSVSYMYSAYSTKDLSELVPWENIGEADCNQRRRYWEENNLIHLRSTYDKDATSLAVVIYNGGAHPFRSHLGIESINGPILIFSNTGEIIKKSTYNGEMRNGDKKVIKRLLQIVQRDENTVYFLHLFRKKKKSLFSPLKEGTLSITKLNLEHGTEEVFDIKKENYLYISGILDLDQEGQLLLGTMALEDPRSDNGRRAYFTLSKIDEEGNAIELDHQTDEDFGLLYSEHRAFPNEVFYSIRSMSMDEGKTLWMLGDRMIGKSPIQNPSDRRGRPTLSERSNNIVGIQVDKSKGKITWTKNYLFQFMDTARVNYKKDGVHIFLIKNVLWRLNQDGSKEKITELPVKFKGIKKKIIPSAKVGFVERENDFIIFGEGRNVNLHIGILKK